MSDIEIYVKSVDKKAINGFVENCFNAKQVDEINDQAFYKNAQICVTVTFKIEMKPEGLFSSIYISPNNTKFQNDAEFGNYANKLLNCDVLLSDDKVDSSSWVKINNGNTSVILLDIN